MSLLGQPVASFYGTPTVGCNPLKVDFVNTTTGATSYLWNFGNGNTSNLKNPGAVYNLPGKYNIVLIAYNSSGQADTLKLVNYVTVFKSPSAKLISNKKQICMGDSMLFQDQTVLGDGKIVKWQWDFGDGGTSSEKNPRYLYTLSGKYDVTLAVVDSNGCQSSFKSTAFSDIIKPPSIAFKSDLTNKCRAPLDVTLTSASSGFGQLKYYWNFGDGSVSNIQNPKHTYQKQGSFGVKLIVEDALGCRDSLLQSNLVKIQDPKADFTVDRKEICAGDQVYFKNSCTPMDITGKFYWEFGNGDTSTKANPSLKYNTPGAYSVRLRYSWDGCSDTVEYKNLIVAREIPKGKVTPRDTSVCRKAWNYLPYSMYGNSIENVYWKVLEKGTTNILNVGLKYNFNPEDNGSYTLVAIPVSKFGCVGKGDTVRIKVRGPSPAIKVDSSKGCIPFNVKAEYSGTSDAPITSYAWDGLGKKGNTASMNFSKVTFGSSTILLTVTDANGCVGVASRIIDGGIVIQPEFKMKEKVCRNEPFWIYNNTKTKKEDSVYFRYSWDKKDTIDFLPVDSIKVKSSDTPDHIRNYTFLAISRGCTTIINHKPGIKIMGPMLEASMFNWCDLDSFAGINKSKAFTRSFWRYENQIGFKVFDANQNLNRKISQTNKLWLYAYNDTNKCSDSMPFTMKMDPIKPAFIGDLNCETGNYKAKNLYTGLADTQFVWTVKHLGTGTVTTFNTRHLNTFLTVGGDHEVTLMVTNPQYTCTQKAVAIVKITPRPKTKPVVTIDRTSCYPVRLSMDYPDFNLWQNARWIIEKTVVKDTAKLMQIDYTGNNKLLNVISLKQDANGCAVSDTFAFKIEGFQANISFNQKVEPCKPVVVSFSPAISGLGNGAFKYSWDFGTKKSNNQQDTVVVPSSRTVYATLLVQDQKGCASMASAQVVVDNGAPQAGFYVNDTTIACPPLNVQFTDSSKGNKYPIVKRIWDFGDGSRSDKLNPGKLYIYPGNYTVSLIVVNSLGCSDTHSIPDLVIVNGPEGTYNFDAFKGCSPLNINLLTAITGRIQKFEFDMGDGTVLDAQDSKHRYVRPGVYIPKLIVIDSNGCKFSPPPKDTITVYPKPTTDFAAGPVCDNSKHTFVHNSNVINATINGFKWSLDGDSVGNQEKVEFAFKKRGQFQQIELIVTTNHNCTDTAVHAVKVYGMDPEVILPDSELCLGQTAVFKHNTFSDTTLTGFDFWVDGKKLDNDDLSYTTRKRGLFPAFLITRDILGCIDTFRDNGILKIGDTIPPPSLFIYSSSVVDDVTTKTKFSESEEVDFKSYKLYVWDNNQWNVANSSENIRDTTLMASGLNTLANSYCHLLTQTNFCNLETDVTSLVSHCTVEVSAIGDTNVSYVDWTPYAGWPVDYYKIHRKRADEPYFLLLDSVPGNTLQYVDSSLHCHIVYDYRIEAVELFGNSEISWSDTARSNPMHAYLVPSPEVWRTTVDSNAFTRTEWLMPKAKYPIVSFNLYRKTQTQWDLLASDLEASKALVYSDYKTQVQDQSYAYMLTAKDACGGVSEPGNIGKSILLQVASVKENGAAKLEWSAYEAWNEGVESYSIERSVAGSDFYSIGSVNGNTLTFIDSTLPTYCTKDFVYRVVGIRNQPVQRDSTHDVKSYSNQRQYIPELRFFIPNAYTPNNNNLNERFRPDGMYWQSYEMKIYNRYGQKLYDNNECLNSWDGTFNGELVSDGVYAYSIRVIDLKGEVYVFNGTIHLLR